MQALLTSVNYDDFLAITLPRTMPHFDQVTVVTAPDDQATIEIAGAHGASVLVTETFYRDGARFDKGAAIDEALRQANGWTCILDADVVLPADMDLSGIEIGCLYSPYRRLLEEPGDIPDFSEWAKLPRGWEHVNHEFAGYFQLFHTDDPSFGDPPWYMNSIWNTAQGGDSLFYARWPRRQLRRLPFEVLHLGELRTNWGGRVTQRWQHASTSQ